MWSKAHQQAPNSMKMDIVSLTPFVERLWGGALCDDTKNGCVADYY